MEKIEVNKKTLIYIKEYIERVEVQIDGEWGYNRELKELIKDGQMPKIYYNILELLTKQTLRYYKKYLNLGSPKRAYLEGSLSRIKYLSIYLRK
jgi:saccharopine dehydrogenase-like NADP-dependent oxidoreductase